MKHLTSLLFAGVAGVALVSSGYAADLIVDEPAAMPGVVESGSWDGAYVGVFAGYGAGTVDDIDEEGYFYTDDYTQDIDGWLLGVTAGANFYLTDGIVAGIVGDIAWSDISGISDWPVETTVDWLGSVRGKLGFDAGAFMPYLTAGLAFAHMNVDDQYYDYQDDATHIGWTAGAGVAVAVSDNLSLDLLYRYSDYGSQDYDIYYSDSSLGLTTHTVQLGLNWKF
jgi:outer membrane immunogenic protein